MKKKKVIPKAKKKPNAAIVVYKEPIKEPEMPEINSNNAHASAVAFAQYLVEYQEYVDPMGRYESKYNAQFLTKCLLKIALGVSPYSAFISCGLHRNTYLTWKNERPQLQCVIEIFVEACDSSYEEILRMHALKNWNAAAFYLERRKRHIYGKEAPVEASDTQKEMIESAKLLGKYAE